MNTAHLQILLADDDDEDCHFFEEVLKEVPLSTALNTVKDGVQLMEYLRLNVQQLPHVLFLDLNMPLKNGFECLEEIKLNEQLRHLPVIILSTSRQENIINMLYKIGASRYIRKSESFEKLKKVIYHALQIIEEKNVTQPPKETFILNNVVSS